MPTASFHGPFPRPLKRERDTKKMHGHCLLADAGHTGGGAAAPERSISFCVKCVAKQHAYEMAYVKPDSKTIYHTDHTHPQGGTQTSPARGDTL